MRYSSSALNLSFTTPFYPRILPKSRDIALRLPWYLDGSVAAKYLTGRILASEMSEHFHLSYRVSSVVR